MINHILLSFLPKENPLLSQPSASEPQVYYGDNLQEYHTTDAFTLLDLT